MNNMRAISAAFKQQWKSMFTSITSLSFLISSVPTVAVLAWIAVRSHNEQVLTYLLVGAPLAGIWSGMVFYIGWSLDDELDYHTLEFALISRTPLVLVIFGKALAHMVYAIPTGIVAVATMFLVARQIPVIADLPLLVVSLLFVFIALIVTSLLFAPLMVVVGGRAGFFNAILPLGTLVGGFMFPIDRLPLALEAVARLIPLSWAMDGVWQSINGTGTLASAFSDWGLCILTSAVWLGVTYLLFKVVIKRIRVTGALGTYR